MRRDLAVLRAKYEGKHRQQAKLKGLLRRRLIIISKCSYLLYFQEDDNKNNASILSSAALALSVKETNSEWPGKDTGAQ